MPAFLLALALAATTPVPVPPAPADALSGFDAPSGKTFSGDFEGTPADAALRKILDAAGLSVVLPDGSFAAVSGHFKNAPVEDALRAVCLEAGLTASRHGAVVTVLRTDSARPLASVSGPAHRDLSPVSASGSRLESVGDRVIAGDVTVPAGERARDVVALGGDVKLESGSSARDVGAVGGSVDVGPGVRVTGDVTAIGGDVHVGPGAEVMGDAAAVGGKLYVAPGAHVHGDKANVNVGLHALPLALPMVHQPHRSTSLHVGLMAAEFAVCFALGLVFVLGWPRGTERVAHALSAVPARSTVIGMLGMFALPVVGILLAMTGIGLVLWPVEGLLFALATLLGFSAMAVLIGRKLRLRARLTPVGQLALGTLLMTVAMNIPKLGPVVLVFAWIAAFGAVLATRFGSQDAGPHPTFPLGDAVDAQPR